MRHQNFFNHQKLRIAKVAISTSAFRNQGSKGMIRAARQFIVRFISLDDFASSLKNNTYNAYLDKCTAKFHRSLIPFGCKWGTARKGLNIYFRDILYNSYFYEELSLHFKYGAQLEIPLDSKTMKKILEHFDQIELSDEFKRPRLSAIVNLDKTNTKLFQNAATEIAKRKYRGYSRVDLDMEFWSTD